jgi:STAS-like domain of unknown function (DUF4325)
MTRILVSQVLSPFCGTADDGERLYMWIHEIVMKDEKVELDFAGVEMASSSFFGALISLLTEGYGPTVFETHVTYRSLKPRLDYVLKRTITAIHA